MKKRIVFSFAVLMSFLLILTCAFPAIAKSYATRELVTLSSVEQLTDCFPDSALRQAVFDAVTDAGEEDESLLTGTSIEDILLKFSGTINASNKGISNVKGLELMRHAEKVNLSRNNISDWSQLNFGNEYYGYGSADSSDGWSRNVNWVIDRNPFSQLPASFGGRLVINQMASTGYVYPADQDETRYFIRTQPGENFDAVYDIGRCRIQGNDPQDNDGIENGFVKLLESSCSFTPLLADGITPDKDLSYSLRINDGPEPNRYAATSGIVKNGKARIGIGVNEVFHYETVDETDTITPGKVSFKYYLNPIMVIYDKVTLTHNSVTGGVSFTKTDSETGLPLADAVYSLYLGEQEIKSNLVTDENGKIVLSGLAPGDYTFRETQAPNGYVLNDQPVSFVIPEATATLGGGYETATASDGTTAKAGENEILLAGAGTPDAVITAGENSGPATVTVTYSSLNAGADPQTFTFASVKEAQDDLNVKKNANSITGPVSIDVAFTGDASREIAVSQTNTPVPTEPTTEPTTVPTQTTQSTTEPTTEPTTQTTTKPTTKPTTQPTTKPTTQSTTKPTTQPTVTLTTRPTETSSTITGPAETTISTGSTAPTGITGSTGSTDPEEPTTSVGSSVPSDPLETTISTMPAGFTDPHQSESGKTPSEENPETGDEIAIPLLAFLSAISLAVCLSFTKNKRYSRK